MFRDILLLIIFLALLLQTDSYEVEVHVTQGTVIGIRQITIFDGKHYFAFYGVPYAQPPIGKLRFKDPKVQKKWIHPLDARTEYHGACAQAHIVHKHGVYGYEDCLYLNIYTPNLPNNNENPNLKSVMIWIHGYAFTSSFSHIHGADFLIDNDVVLITLTHRLGVFGFLKANETDSNANMGLKDIVMALKWIRREVKKFGGDKNKITLMGSGSAATLLSLLLTTKSSKLFSKLILQSGSMFSPSIFQGDHILERERLQQELRKIGLKDIKNVTTKDIIHLSQKIYRNIDMMNSQKPLVPFTPMIEATSKKSLVTKTSKEFYENIGNLHTNKSILIGFNSQESISEVIPFLHNPYLLKPLAVSFKYMMPFTDGCKFNHTSKTYKYVGDKIKKRYFSDGISEKSVDSFLRYTSDLQKYPIYKFIKTHSNVKGSKIFMYKFNYNGNFNAVKRTSTAGVNIKVRGASNGDEVCYILKCEPLWETYVQVSRNVTNPDRIFIQQVAELWANFAKTGDPTPNSYRGNITWPPVTVNNDNMLLISRKSEIVDSKSEKRMYSFWNELYENFYSPEHCRQTKHDEL